VKRDVELHAIGGSVDEHGGRDRLHAGGTDRLDGLDERRAGREDVVDDGDPFVGCDLPPALQRTATGLDGLREGGADVAAQVAGRLEGQQHAARGRPDHEGRTIRCKDIRQPAAELVPVARMLEDEELLEVAPRVPPGLQEEVAVEQGSRVGEEGLNARGGQGRIGHS
jgi:hypothetical protein